MQVYFSPLLQDLALATFQRPDPAKNLTLWLICTLADKPGEMIQTEVWGKYREYREDAHHHFWQYQAIIPENSENSGWIMRLQKTKCLMMSIINKSQEKEDKQALFLLYLEKKT